MRLGFCSLISSGRVSAVKEHINMRRWITRGVFFICNFHL